MQRLRLLDESVSCSIAFRISLPWFLELLLSLPGNLMGPPLIQVAGPLWILVLFSRNSNLQVSAQLWGSAIAVTCSMLLFWILFLRGNAFFFSKILFGNASFALAPPLGVFLCHMLAPTTHAFAISIHSILLYTASCIIILFLKQATLRKRPCCVYPRYIQRKHLTIIPCTLQKVAPDASFPSGDVMSATSLSLSIAHLGYANAATALVTLAAFGRMYFLAHHAVDTVVGIGICIGMNWIFSIGWGISIGMAEWYHPIVAFVGLVVASRFRQSNQK